MFGRKDGVTPDALTSIFSAAKAKQEDTAAASVVAEAEESAAAAEHIPDEDLSAELDALDIDGMNFDDDDDDDNNNNVEETKTSANDDDADDKEDNNVENWRDRVELYSRHFRPSKSEAAVLESVAEELRVRANLRNAANNNHNDSQSGLFGMFGGGGGGDKEESTISKSSQHSSQAQWDRLVSGKNAAQTKDFPISILLRRGTVTYNDRDDESDDNKNNEVECELLLFTRGFMLATRQQGGGGFLGMGGGKTGLTPVGSALWTDVHRIQSTPSQTLVLTCGGGGGGGKGDDDDDEASTSVSFEIVPPLDELPQWTKDLQDAAIHAHQNLMTMTDDKTLGWQYRLCQTPFFTDAVTNQVDEGHEMPSDDTDYSQGLNQLDEYHGLAPLHYAVRLNKPDSIRALLEAGANPNVADAEGKSPMYYAERDALPASTRKLMEQFGGVKSDKIQAEQRGELFGKVEQTEDYREKKKQAEAIMQAAKAEAAQNQMAQNIQLMHKRGEQIEELGVKANDMNEGAEDFADMAKQLKEKMKKKSKWGF